MCRGPLLKELSCVECRVGVSRVSGTPTQRTLVCRVSCGGVSCVGIPTQRVESRNHEAQTNCHSYKQIVI